MYGMASDDLGIRIRRARERRGWSQQELADGLTAQRGGRTVGVRSVGRWERGEAVPRNAIGALEQILGVNLTSNGAVIVYPDLSNPAEALIWGMTRYSEEERREFLLDLRARIRAGTG